MPEGYSKSRTTYFHAQRSIKKNTVINIDRINTKTGSKRYCISPESRKRGGKILKIYPRSKSVVL